MLHVYETVERLAPPLDLGDMKITAVSFRPKRFESTVDKLTCEPGKLADMADIGGVRAVVDTQLTRTSFMSTLRTPSRWSV